MKEAWVSCCSETIQEFVERSTRLQPNKLDLTLVEKIDFDCQINLSLYFRLKQEDQYQAGRVPAGNGIHVFYQAFQYKSALQAETSAVLSRKETLREAREWVLMQPYGAVKKEAVIYSHPERLCLTENCNTCNGRGQVNCTRCYGSGRGTCTGCGGSGQVLGQRSYYDHYTKQNRVESYYHSCHNCGGGGSVRCNYCSGSGNQKCSPCEGTGETTRITRLYSVATPNYQLIYFREDVQTFIKDGLYKAGITELGKLGTVELANSEIDDVSRSVDFRFNAQIPFARFNSQLPQTQTDDRNILWIVYGIKPQILDAGHVIELMLKSDLNNLVYQASGGKLLNPLVAAFSRKTVSTFMESEAHQEMLDANRKGKSGESLREALNRGVTTTYLDEALTSLKSVMKAIQNWSVVKWAIFSTIIIYLLMPLYTAFGNIWTSHNATERVYLTPFTRWDNQQNLLSSLEVLVRYCGLFIGIVAFLVPLLGYLWRRGWVYWRVNQHLAAWAVEQNILRSGWLVSFFMTSLFSLSLLLFFPIWVTQDGLLFGQYPLTDLISWMVNFIR